ncbi:hypothetical protein Tco_0752626 [Tanacetum coccineum]|uniref:Uncharacterized protein n=1 Tax=Tanacetum coccineum TaxID=301880 RepID=A0ABQ4Z7J0_9ASTR
MELHDVSYGIEYVTRPLLLFFSSENRLLWFRYREYDLAHLKLVFEFSIYNVWKSVQYGVSNGLDTAYWGFLGARIRRIFLMDTAYLSLRISSGIIMTITLLKTRLTKLHEQTLPPKEGAPALHAIRAGRIQKNQKKKSHKAAKGNQEKGKAKMGYAPVQAPPFASKPKNPL